MAGPRGDQQWAGPQRAALALLRKSPLYYMGSFQHERINYVSRLTFYPTQPSVSEGYPIVLFRGEHSRYPWMIPSSVVIRELPLIAAPCWKVHMVKPLLHLPPAS